MKGILGRKVGMTQVFSEHGRSIPVTVIEVQPNVVTNVLTKEKHGYTAVQLAAFDRREKTSTKPLIGHFKKASTGPKYYVREIRDMDGFEIGQEVKGTIFGPGQLVDVEGISKGHGFQGTIKRYNQHIGPKSHGGGGGSQPVRQTGSLGDMVSNRVFKGMTMPGHMGVDKVTVQNLEVVAFNEKINALLVKGSVPGPKKGFVVVTEAIKGLPSRQATNIIDNGKELEVKTPVASTKAKKVVKIETKQKLEQPLKVETKEPTEIVEKPVVEEMVLPESSVVAPQSVPEEEIDEALEMEMLEHGEEE